MRAANGVQSFGSTARPSMTTAVSASLTAKVATLKPLASDPSTPAIVMPGMKVVTTSAVARSPVVVVHSHHPPPTTSTNAKIAGPTTSASDVSQSGRARARGVEGGGDGSLIRLVSRH